MFGWFGKVSFVPYSKVQDFAVHLKDGRLMGSRCKGCGFRTFPPRADCPECMSADFEFHEYGGEGTLYTYTRIDAAPTGFDDEVPYTIAASGTFHDLGKFFSAVALEERIFNIRNVSFSKGGTDDGKINVGFMLVAYQYKG